MWFSRYMRFSNSFKRKPNGDGEIRTLDPLLARQVLSQLSYAPVPGGITTVSGFPSSRFSFLLSFRHWA